MRYTEYLFWIFANVILPLFFIGSMVMDITEQVEQKTGRREEGLLGTVSSFVHKVVGAGGVMISGLILSISGWAITL